MMRFLWMLVPVATGLASSLQAATNAGLALRASVPTMVVVNVLGTLAGVVALFVLPAWRPAAPPPATPLPYLLGGVYGLVIVAGLAAALPRFGAAWTIALFVLGQGATALAIDHYGWLGQARDPLTLARAAGMGLVVAGVLLLRWR